MAALSYYSNWDTFQPSEMMNTDTSFLAQQETNLFPDQFFDYDSFDELFPDSSYSNEIDHLFQPNDILYSQNYNNNNNNNNNIPNQLPYNNNNNNLLTPLPDYTLHTPLVEFDPFQDLKRQKLFDTYNFPLHSDQLINPSLLQHNFQPEFVLPEFVAAPPVYSGGSYAETVTKPPPAASGGGSLSAQSASARQRRRKITEKTHELGKLVPGGQKMNTAEMLQSAYKYIKFLQAEVGILDSMGSYNHQGNGDQSELLHGLITSPLIQEKLYSAEKCLVPEKFVQALANDDDTTLESKPQLRKEINELRIIDLSN
ncbi:hypothetical protein ABFS82_08G124000 [Erythranthe guttata]|uniref:BHLH domain-containing protein n=1 Tax=Erythranthe guttata TaxID=4155 RepID=A0A022RW68_ERYGU|nr:hypothetical protein MIMGU_mgv1a023790mg [Erythranthe guttata]